MRPTKKLGKLALFGRALFTHLQAFADTEGVPGDETTVSDEMDQADK